MPRAKPPGARRYRKMEIPMWTDARFRALSAPAPNAQTLWIYLLSGPRTTVFPGLVIATPEALAADLKWPLNRTLQIDLDGQGSRVQESTPRRVNGTAGSGGPTGTRVGTWSPHHVPEVGDTFGTSRGSITCASLRDALRELEDLGMIEVDSDAGVVLLTRALFTGDGEPRDSSHPGQPQAIGTWEKSWADIPECRLKDQYLLELDRYVGTYGGALQKTFRAAFKIHLNRVGRPCTQARVHGGETMYPSSGTWSGDLREKKGSQEQEQEQEQERSDPEDRDLPRAREVDRVAERQADPARPSDRPDQPLLLPVLQVVPSPIEQPGLPGLFDSTAIGSPDGSTGGQTASQAEAVRPVAGVLERDSVRSGAPIPPPSQPRAETENAQRSAREAAWHAWERMNRGRQDLARELGLPPPHHLHHQLPGFLELQRRLAESGPDAHAHLEHVLAIGAAVARASGSLRYFAACLFDARAWQTKLGMTVDDALAEHKHPPPGRGPSGPSGGGGSRSADARDAFDAVDRATAAIDRATRKDPQPAPADRKSKPTESGSHTADVIA